MQFNPEEMSALAQADAAAPRMDIYAFIHKALRAFMADTLVGLGRVDADDDLQCAQACARVLQLLDLCRSHLRHENHFVHPAMERHAPQSSATVAREHAVHEQLIDALAAGVAHLQACPGGRRARAAHALYGQLALFVAHNFEHMHQEETAHNAVLWAHHSDAELAQLEGAIVASIPPEETFVTMRWMLPCLTPAERALVLGGMQAQAPAPAFAAVLEVLRPHLAPAEWERLMRDLGMATP